MRHKTSNMEVVFWVISNKRHSVCGIHFLQVAGPNCGVVSTRSLLQHDDNKSNPFCPNNTKLHSFKIWGKSTKQKKFHVKDRDSCEHQMWNFMSIVNVKAEGLVVDTGL